ncbi:MAG: methyl-accepting chemotaxis protein [Lachnospiraceae bacterium]|nr:methyl-accepting chemotaxis protein [Lachnospiraceae bacterium]
MKLRTKIVLLAILPAFLFSTVQYTYSMYRMDQSITDKAYEGMQATGVVATALLDALGDGAYEVKNGELYKGNYNLSEEITLLDSLKQQSGFDVTLFYGDTRYLTTIADENGNRQVGTQASEAVVSEVLKKGATYCNDNANVLGKRYVDYYLPLYQTGTKDVAGMLFLGQSYDEMHAIVHDTKSTIGLFSLFLTIILAIVAYLIAMKLVNNISTGISYVTQLEEGHLGFKMEKSLMIRKDVIGDMCRSVKHLEKKLRAIIQNMQDQCTVLEEAATTSSQRTEDAISSVMQIDQTIQNIANNSSSQAASAVAAGDNVSEMGSMIERTGQQVDSLTDTTDTMAAASNQAKDILNELNENMNKVREAVRTVSDQTSQTHDSVQAVGKMTEVITDIASQTTLLSLNASIEAARAGEQGKGFAVVASEIQQLAEQSNKAAEEIQVTLRKLWEDSDSSVATMNEVEKIIQEQGEKISDTNAIFQTVEDNIENSINGIKEIKTKTHALDETRGKTIEVVQNVASSAQENAASTEETAAFTDQVTEKVTEIENAMNSVQNVIQELEKSIEIFSLTD